MAVRDANDTLDGVNSALSSTDPIFQNLESVKSLALAVLNISLPSLESAVELARQINESIIPEEILQDILANATAGRTTADLAWAAARNARCVEYH